MKFNITQLENVEIDLEVVESGLLLKPIKKNRREDLAKNINQILENSKNKEDKRSFTKSPFNNFSDYYSIFISLGSKALSSSNSSFEAFI